MAIVKMGNNRNSGKWGEKGKSRFIFGEIGTFFGVGWGGGDKKRTFGQK